MFEHRLGSLVGGDLGRCGGGLDSQGGKLSGDFLGNVVLTALGRGFDFLRRFLFELRELALQANIFGGQTVDFRAGDGFRGFRAFDPSDQIAGAKSAEGSALKCVELGNGDRCFRRIGSGGLGGSLLRLRFVLVGFFLFAVAAAVPAFAAGASTCFVNSGLKGLRSMVSESCVVR
jgi:hypothetical protein